MAVRRPNKKSAPTPTRKPTVAGRKKVAVERDAEETTAVVPTEAVEVDVEEAAESALTDETDVAEVDVEETDPTADSVDAAADTAADDDFEPVDEPAPARVPLVKPDVEEAAEVDADTVETDDADSADADSDADESPTLKPSGKARRPVARVSTIKADATRAPKAGTPEPESSGRLAGISATAGEWTKRLTPADDSFVTARNAIRLGVAAAIIGLIALVLAFTPGATIGPNKAFINQAETDQLMSQARTKLCLPIAVTSKDFDKWAGQARAVLVGTALKNFNEYLPTQKQLIEQSKLVADCRVDAIGVRELTIDDAGSHAKVLANILVSQNLGEQLLNSASVRVDYTMEKQGDQWVISGVEPF